MTTRTMPIMQEELTRQVWATIHNDRAMWAQWLQRAAAIRSEVGPGVHGFTPAGRWSGMVGTLARELAAWGAELAADQADEMAQPPGFLERVAGAMLRGGARCVDWSWIADGIMAHDEASAVHLVGGVAR